MRRMVSHVVRICSMAFAPALKRRHGSHPHVGSRNQTQPADVLSGMEEFASSMSAAETAVGLHAPGDFDMDPLTFILTVASAVLANLLTDLITGSTADATSDEISTRINVQLNGSPAYGQTLQPQILEEVYTLAKRTNEFTFTGAALRLRGAPSPDTEQLQFHLARLGAIVDERRRELGLPRAMAETGSEPLEQASTQVAATTPLASDTHPDESDAEHAAIVQWIPPDPPVSEDPWACEVRAMQERIRRRRLEGER